MKKRIVSAFLALTFILAVLSGCSAQVKSHNLIDGITPDPVAVKTEFVNDEARAVSDFAAELLKQSYTSGTSMVISPISVLYALAMTANGADGETLSQMETVFGMDIDTLNEYLYSTVGVLPSDEGYDVDLANSIWVNDNEEKFAVSEEFLKTVKSYYDAGVYMSAFDDAALKDINNWVVQKTNGQIQDILDKIDSDAVMYLVNAINFEADWLDEYNEYAVKDSNFTQADGRTQTGEFMYSGESVYLEDADTTGFIKYYKDKKYAFAALLPNNEVKFDDYIANLSGEKLADLLLDAREVNVDAVMPKFETTFDIEMSRCFENLGMTNAFDWRLADFSKMGQAQQAGENVCINRIIHKAFIRVAEKGTQAGAATVVEMVAEGAMEAPEEIKNVRLDRPFVYMIVDTQNNLPVFIGTVCNID